MSAFSHFQEQIAILQAEVDKLRAERDEARDLLECLERERNSSVKALNDEGRRWEAEVARLIAALVAEALGNLSDRAMVDPEDAEFLGEQVIEMCDRLKVMHAVLPGSRATYAFEEDGTVYRLVMTVEEKTDAQA